MAATHVYRADLDWSGSTAVGYRTYERAHRVTIPPATAELTVSADPAFRGDPALLNPEQLLLAAAASCQLLSFLALAARAGLDVVGYRDHAEAAMPATRDRMRITTVTLRPRIVVDGGFDVDEVTRLVHAAHDECYIANTLACDVVVEPTIEAVATRGTPGVCSPGDRGYGHDMANNAQSFADALQQLENDGDVAAFVDKAFADDVELVRPETDRSEHGTDGATRFWEQYLGQFEQIHSEFSRVVDGPVAVLEWTSSGRTRQGSEISYRGVSLLDVADDGRVTRFATYYDTAPFAVNPPA